jgi:DNA-binding response OmpR family regulator
VCERHEATLESLCDHLTADRNDILPAPTASYALRLCRYNQPDLMVLDLTLPDASGLDVLREIRQADGISARYDAELPIIVLSARDGDTERVRVLEEGADDFLVKPAPYEELRARIGAVLRRSRCRTAGPTRVGELLVDPASWKVIVGERDVRLAKKEFRLLLLASDPTRVFSKDELLAQVWGEKQPSGPTRTLDSHASRLRSKLDPVERHFVINAGGSDTD